MNREIINLMKFVSIFLFMVSYSTFSQVVATTTTTQPTCPIGYIYDTDASQCSKACSKGFTYSHERDKCEKACDAGTKRNPFTGQCKPIEFVEKDVGQKITRNFLLGASCSTNTPEHRYASEMLHKDTTNIFGFENLFKSAMARDRFDLMKDLKDLLTNTQKTGMLAKRNNITIEFNKEILDWRKNYFLLVNAKNDSSETVTFLGKDYKESELANIATNPGNIEQYLLDEELIKIKNRFYKKMNTFYKEYYTRFQAIQKAAASQSSHNSDYKIGHPGEKCKKKLWRNKDIKHCWSHKIQVKNTSTYFDKLKDYEFIYKSDLGTKTQDAKMSLYDLIFSYDNFKTSNGFSLKNNYFVDFPFDYKMYNKITYSDWNKWDEKKNNTYGFLLFKSDRYTLESSKKPTLFKDLLTHYGQKTQRTARLSPLHNVNEKLYIYPELGVTKGCLSSTNYSESHKCYKSASVMKNVVAKTMKYFFLYSNNSKKSNLEDMFQGTVAPDSAHVLGDFDLYQYDPTNNRGIFFSEISSALARARNSYKTLGSEEYKNDSLKCIKTIIEKLGGADGVGNGFDRELSDNPNATNSGNQINSTASNSRSVIGSINRNSNSAGSGTFGASSTTSQGSSQSNLTSNSSTRSGSSANQSDSDNQYSIQTANAGSQNGEAVNAGSLDNSIASNNGNDNNTSSSNSIAHSGSSSSGTNDRSTSSTQRDSNNSYSARKGSSRSSRSNTNSGFFDGLPTHATANSAGGIRSTSRGPANTHAGLRARGLKGAHSALFKKITDVYVESAYPTIFDN